MIDSIGLRLARHRWAHPGTGPPSTMGTPRSTPRSRLATIVLGADPRLRLRLGRYFAATAVYALCTLLVAFAVGEEHPLCNCSARLLAAAPLHVRDAAAALGDIDPGELVVAGFAVQVDSDALPGEYQMGCELTCREKRITLPLTITLSSAGWPEEAALAALALAPSAVLAHSFRPQSRWR